MQITKALAHRWHGGRLGEPQRRKAFGTGAFWGIGKIARSRAAPLNLASEAHLAPWKRSLNLVRYMRDGKRRSHAGRAVVIGCILLNELRGLFVVAAVLKAWHG